MSAANEEMERVRDEFRAFERKLMGKVDVEEVRRIWDNFANYALYDDLKDLYAKTMPEIKKFEDRIIQFSLDLEKIDIIMRRFDEIMTEKASKMDLRDLAKNISMYVKN